MVCIAWSWWLLTSTLVNRSVAYFMCVFVYLLLTNWTEFVLAILVSALYCSSPILLNHIVMNICSLYLNFLFFFVSLLYIVCFAGIHCKIDGTNLRLTWACTSTTSSSIILINLTRCCRSSTFLWILYLSVPVMGKLKIKW